MSQNNEGGLIFEIDKRRLSVRLTAPISIMEIFENKIRGILKYLLYDKPSPIRYNINQSILFCSLRNEREIFQWMRM